jgi:hypothetical protein
MALYSKLDVVNRALGLQGLAPVNDIDSPHPAVPAALERLSLALKAMQARRWWFNTEYPTLAPQADNQRIAIPNNTVSIDAVDPRVRVTQRGRWLYDTIRSSYEFPAPVPVRLHRFVEFDDLPPTAAHYAMTQALVTYAADMDGDAQRVRLLLGEDEKAWNALTAEDTRNANVNLLRRAQVATGLQRVAGQSPFQYRR